MKYLLRLAFIGCLFVGLAGTSLLAKESVPALTARVNDYANKLTVTERNDLEQMLAAAEAQSSNQIVVLVTPSLNGDSVEDYAQRVFDSWRLGQKGRDNGVLVLWAPSERKVRIHVGYGLEGRLTDAVCAQIIRNDLIPSLKADLSFLGLRNTVQSIMKAVKGEYKAESAQSKGFFTGAQILALIVAGIIAIVCGIAGSKVGGIAGAICGALAGAIAWQSFAAVAILAVIGFVFGLIAWPIISAVGDSDSSSGGSSWSSGSSSSSSGYSGGGGSSGGGGASGSY